jgi:hypothetical protein
MPGATAFGLHEGSRSEYLAQYAFASWGTAVAIPHQEDHGIDLACTLMERVGRRYLARCPYTVQVKSGLEPLAFEGEEEVRWLVEHPLPFYLCVVDKPSARLSIYHTFPRFLLWASGRRQARLQLVPLLATEGNCTGGIGNDIFWLAPILDFTVGEMLDDEFWRRARQIFGHWVEVENDNLTRIRAGLPRCRVPFSYRTNEGIVEFAEVSRSLPKDEPVANAHMKECLEWIGRELCGREDIRGAAKTTLLLRHLFPADASVLPIGVHRALGGPTGVDRLGGIVDAAISRAVVVDGDPGSSS